LAIDKNRATLYKIINSISRRNYRKRNNSKGIGAITRRIKCTAERAHQKFSRPSDWGQRI